MVQDSLVSGQSNSGKPVSRLFGRYLIKNQFQLKFSLILLGILAAATLIIWMESRMIVNNLLETGAVYNEQTKEQLQIMTQIIGKTSFLIMAITFGITLFLSHFVAGPLYRFEKTFQEIQQGNLTVHVRLRKYDELQDVADSINQGLAGLRNKVKKERDKIVAVIQSAEELVKEFKAAGMSKEATKVEEMIADLKAANQEVKI